jgi:hypothetical protein
MAPDEPRENSGVGRRAAFCPPGPVVADALAGQVGRTLIAALAIATVAAIAGLVDQRAPTVEALARVALPSGALLGLAWTMAVLRQERADVATATLGARPGLLWGLGVGLAVGVCALSPPRAESPPPVGATLDVTPERLVARHGNQVLEIRWDETGARPAIDRAGEPGPGLSAPTGSTPARSAGAPPRLLVWGLLTALLAGVLARSGPPGLLRTVVSAAFATAVGFAVGA